MSAPGFEIALLLPPLLWIWARRRERRQRGLPDRPHTRGANAEELHAGVS